MEQFGLLKNRKGEHDTKLRGLVQQEVSLEKMGEELLEHVLYMLYKSSRQKPVDV